MESFYGGRQGLSFVIKKAFDYIGAFDENQKPITFYRYGDYLYDISQRGFIVNDNGKLISRADNVDIDGNALNLDANQKWKLLLKNGEQITESTFYKDGRVNNNPVTVDLEKATTMIEHFSKGIVTTNEVNYGEYVIISAQRGKEMGIDNGQDVLINGRVYRRGLDYNDPMAGAEFIGQICGPQGMSPELYFDSFNNIKDYEEISSENDDIKLIQGTKDNSLDTVFKIRTERNPENLNGVNEYKMGIQIPYSGFAFSGNSVNYNQSASAELKLNESHNFFHSYLINIPNGVPGNDFSKVFQVCEKVNNNTAINYYTYSNGQYIQETNTLPIGIEIFTIVSNAEEWLDNTGDTYIKIKYPIDSDDNIYYVKRQDTYSKALYAEIINYNKQDKNDAITNQPIPTKTYHKIGDYKIITNIEMSDNGEITVYYDGYNNVSLNQNNPIRWIKETVVVNEDDLNAIIQQYPNEINGIPNIGDVLVRYNTDVGLNDDKYYYPINNDATLTGIVKQWHKVGFAQNLTGLKIFATVDDINDITLTIATAVPAGWGIFIPAKRDIDNNITEEAYIIIKNGSGDRFNDHLNWPKIYVSSFGVGAQTPELIYPTNYSTGVDNLEQELLFGKETYIEEYYDTHGNKIVETHYCNEETLNTPGSKYYKTKTILYRADNIEKSFKVENGVLVEFKTDNDYTDLVDNTLILTTGRMYNFENNNLSIAADNKVKEDIFSLVTVGSDIETIILTKLTLKQELPNGRTIIKEINTKGNN